MSIKYAGPYDWDKQEKPSWFVRLWPWLITLLLAANAVLMLVNTCIH